MKILGRIKKSKVLTAVMTAVLIFQSACPTGLAYAAEQARSSAVLTVTASVDDLDETLPTLKSPTDFTAGSAIGTCPAFWVANDDGTSYVEALMAKKQKQGLALNWYNEETGESFDWYKTKVTDSIHVVGKWEKYDVSVTFSANDGTTKSDTETVPYGQSYKQAFGKEKAAPATRKGYEFAGWYDSTTNKPFDFTKKLTDPTVSVYAKWNLKDAVEVSPSDTARPAQTATGTCSINGTWFGTPFYWGSIARFNLSHFTGELAGATVNDAQCVDSGAENPYLAGRRTATYQATLTSFDETTGKAVYDVYIYPAGHATGDMYVMRPVHNSYHNTQVGVQRMHTTITVYKVVKGYIELQKASTCTNVSDNNKLYSLAGAEFSIYDASGKFVQKLTTNEKGETAIFFGLSGTGKTTLSTDPKRQLIGDDEHGWDDDGVFNFEGGCYAKVINLSQENEPDIWNAIRRNALLENVTVDKKGKIDYADKSVTENTRVSYPIFHIENIVKPVSKAPAAKKVIFLSADAFGVLPPVSILTPEQTKYYFLSGFTAKLAGTERGITEPTPTFSACFGAAFLSLHPTKYGEELVKRMKQSGATAYLVNTGWNGTGKRISIKDTRGIIDAILDGSIDKAPTKTLPVFDFKIPTALPGVDPKILDPRDTYKNAKEWDEKAADLAGRFIKNFEKFTGNAEGKKLVAAGPHLK